MLIPMELRILLQSTNFASFCRARHRQKDSTDQSLRTAKGMGNTVDLQVSRIMLKILMLG